MIFTTNEIKRLIEILEGSGADDAQHFIDKLEREIESDGAQNWKNISDRPSTPPPPRLGNHRPQPRKNDNK